MTTTEQQIDAYLQQLGWQAYIPAFAALLQRFDGTQEWIITQETDTLPECLCAWLASLVGANAKPLPLALFSLRRWYWFYFHVATRDGMWDYRKCSFMEFCRQAEATGQFLDVWDYPRRSRLYRPSLAQGLGFLRQHCHPAQTAG